MTHQLILSPEPINEAELIHRQPPTPETGAVVRFLGVVRGSEEGQAIRGIEYEAFREMAEHQFRLLFEAVAQRWPVFSIYLVHRTGFVAVGEPSLWVELTAAHRGEAFAACEYLIDEMKRLVPIWKKPVPA